MRWKIGIITIVLLFGFLIIPGSVFAEQSVVTSSGSTWDLISSNNIGNSFVPLLKSRGSVDVDDIEAFMALPTEDKIFVIVAALAIIIFIAWYTLKGKFMKLSYRIPIIITFFLLIFIPLYLLGNMMYFVTALIVAFTVLIVIWYQEHGRQMSPARLIGTVIVTCLVLGLVIGVPGYFYFTATDEISDVIVASNDPDLKIVDYKVYRNMFGSQSEVQFEGYVQNIGNEPKRFVQVNVTGYDANGNIIANKTTFVDDNILQPGSKSPFGELSSYYAGYLEDPQNMIVKIRLEPFTTLK